MKFWTITFAIICCVNFLNTPDNLERWGIHKSDKCDLCKNRSNLGHTLDYGPVTLKQERFKWRNDSVLNHIIQELTKSNKKNPRINTFFFGQKMFAGNIPPDVFVTIEGPFVVILDKKVKKFNFVI